MPESTFLQLGRRAANEAIEDGVWTLAQLLGPPRGALYDLDDTAERQAAQCVPGQKISLRIVEFDLEKIADECGIGPEALNETSTAMLMVAAQLEDFVKQFKIPVAQRRSSEGKKVLVEREVERVIEKTSYVDGERKSEHPSDSLDLAPIDGLEDLPRILPSQWLLEDISEDEFLRRLSARELIQYEWREPTRTPVKSHETVKERKTFEETAPPEIEKQHAYVLLDRSGSIFGGDGRDIVAAGLAIAFLREGHRQLAQLAYRPFESIPGEMISGRDAAVFKQAVHQVIWGNGGGGTDIEGAVRTAVGDIRAQGQFAGANILLISDGLSQLHGNPLGEIKLHTCIVGSSERDVEGSELATLKSWSTSMHFLDSSAIAGLFEPTPKVTQDLSNLSKAILERTSDLSSEEQRLSLLRTAKFLEQAVRRQANLTREKARQQGGQEELRERLLAQVKAADELEAKTAVMKRKLESQETIMSIEANRNAAHMAEMQNRIAQEQAQAERLSRQRAELRAERSKTLGEQPRTAEQSPIPETLWQRIVRWAKSVLKKR